MAVQEGDYGMVEVIKGKHKGKIGYYDDVADNGDAGASLKAVQEHLGHTSLAMTQKYAHLSPQFQKAEVEKLSGVFAIGLVNSKKLVRSDQKPDFQVEGVPYANA